MDKLQEEGDFLGRWLNDNLSDKEIADFKNTEDYPEYHKIIQTLEEIKAPKFETEVSLGKIKSRIEEAKSSKSKSITLVKSKSYSLLVAASISLILAVTYVLFYMNSFMPDSGEMSYATTIGEKHAIDFPDGSSVKINVASQLSYDRQNWNKKRTINLEGEAFFEVNPGSPFTVETSSEKIEVLGTSFNVKSRKDVLEVFCYTGEVRVKGDNFQEVLHPGEGIRTKNKQLVKKLNSNNIPQAPSWLDGISSMDNIPLSEALEELCLYFDLKIASDLDLSQFDFTGDFPHADLNLSIKLLLDPFNQLKYDYDVTHKTLTIASNE